MTYNNLKKYITENKNSKHCFDLMPQSIKSKIILCVGDNSSNVLTFLSSIMNEYNISHSKYSGCKYTDFKCRFQRFQSNVEMSELCSVAEAIIKKSNKTVSNEALLLTCAFTLLDGEDYLLMDVSEEAYNSLAKIISPFALILAINDDEYASSLIETSNSSTEYIISSKSDNDYSYLPSEYAPNGALISYASKNKITVKNASPLGTDFFHYDYLYHIPTIDQKSIPLAHIAIEASSLLFSAIRPKIYRGLEKARGLYDLSIYSLSPTVLLRIGKPDFILHHRMKFKIVTAADEISKPTENTVFCGNYEFISKVKSILES